MHVARVKSIFVQLYIHLIENEVIYLYNIIFKNNLLYYVFILLIDLNYKLLCLDNQIN